MNGNINNIRKQNLTKFFSILTLYLASTEAMYTNSDLSIFGLSQVFTFITISFSLFHIKTDQ